MRKAKDFTGQKVGRLTVIERAPDKFNPNGSPVIVWKCQCECGLIVLRRSSHLRRGRCTCSTCKALAEHKKYGFKDIRAHHWYNIQKQAAKRNIEFDITMSYAWGIFKSQNSKCALSGIPIWFAKTKKEHAAGGTTASLDRIDSKKGYLEGNVQWVHKWINRMKNKFTTEEFYNYCKKIVEYQEGKTDENKTSY